MTALLEGGMSSSAGKSQYWCFIRSAARSEILMPPIKKLSKWEIIYSFLIILPMAAAMTIGDYILRRRATGNDG